MDFFQFMLIIFFIIGCLFIAYSVINFHGQDSESAFDLEEALMAGNKLNKFDHTIKEADNVINELSDISQTVFKQFDEKYQELLFLYNLVDEKKQEIEELPQTNTVTPQKTASIDIVVDDKTRPGFSHRLYAQIIKLKNDGMDTAEIAKILDIGKGEVSLILELGKGRKGNA